MGFTPFVVLLTRGVHGTTAIDQRCRTIEEQSMFGLALRQRWCLGSVGLIPDVCVTSAWQSVHNATHTSVQRHTTDVHHRRAASRHRRAESAHHVHRTNSRNAHAYRTTSDFQSRQLMHVSNTPSHRTAQDA